MHKNVSISQKYYVSGSAQFDDTEEDEGYFDWTVDTENNTDYEKNPNENTQATPKSELTTKAPDVTTLESSLTYKNSSTHHDTTTAPVSPANITMANDEFTSNITRGK